MAGSQINIFSMMMVSMWVYNPLNSIMMTQKTFTDLAGPGKVDLTMAKLTFVGLNLALLGVALYKLSTLGLLPITAADWVRLVLVLSLSRSLSPQSPKNFRRHAQLTLSLSLSLSLFAGIAARENAGTRLVGRGVRMYRGLET